MDCIYLAGEIHSSWRDELIEALCAADLNFEYRAPETEHDLSDSCGTNIFGAEESKFWRDRKSANLNSFRIQSGIREADIAVVYFGEKYRQWNTAFEAGLLFANEVPFICWHPEEYDHALKDLDAVALAVAREQSQVLEALRYISRSI